MLTIGNQLRAARALVGMEAAALAERAGVDVSAIDAMEKRGSETFANGPDVVRAVAAALERAGVEFLNHGRPGVRLRAASAAERSDTHHARSNDEWPEADA